LAKRDWPLSLPLSPVNDKHQRPIHSILRSHSKEVKMIGHLTRRLIEIEQVDEFVQEINSHKLKPIAITNKIDHHFDKEDICHAIGQRGLRAALHVWDRSIRPGKVELTDSERRFIELSSLGFIFGTYFGLMATETDQKFTRRDIQNALNSNDDEIKTTDDFRKHPRKLGCNFDALPLHLSIQRAKSFGIHQTLNATQCIVFIDGFLMVLRLIVGNYSPFGIN